VKDPLFLEHVNFFDPCDNFQIRYEMLRSHLIESDSVVGVCRRFGLSRQSFYTLEEKFKQEGNAGLLPKKPGPQAPSKLTVEVLEFVLHSLQAEEKIAMVEIKSQIQQKFGISLHRRTVEKLCKDLTLKKTLADETQGDYVKKLVTDLPRLRYEELRIAFFEGGHCERNGYWESFRLDVFIFARREAIK